MWVIKDKSSTVGAAQCTPGVNYSRKLFIAIHFFLQLPAACICSWRGCVLNRLPEFGCAQDPGEGDAVPLHQTPAHCGDRALPARCVQRTRQPVDHLPLVTSIAVSQQKLGHVTMATSTLDMIVYACQSGPLPDK